MASSLEALCLLAFHLFVLFFEPQDRRDGQPIELLRRYPENLPDFQGGTWKSSIQRRNSTSRNIGHAANGVRCCVAVLCPPENTGTAAGTEHNKQRMSVRSGRSACCEQSLPDNTMPLLEKHLFKHHAKQGRKHAVQSASVTSSHRPPSINTSGSTIGTIPLAERSKHWPRPSAWKCGLECARQYRRAR